MSLNKDVESKLENAKRILGIRLILLFAVVMLLGVVSHVVVLKAWS